VSAEARSTSQSFAAFRTKVDAARTPQEVGDCSPRVSSSGPRFPFPPPHLIPSPASFF